MNDERWRVETDFRVDKDLHVGNDLEVTNNLQVSKDISVGSTTKGSDTVVKVLSNSNHKAGFEAYGNTEGTGYLYVGQSSTYGGGISYNGDGSPQFVEGEEMDRITFFRRNNGNNTEVFSYSYASNDVEFNGNIKINKLELGYYEKQSTSQGQNIVCELSDITNFDAVFFEYVIKKETNLRAGSIYSVHDGTNVKFTETYTEDLGDTSEVVLSVDINNNKLRLLATTETTGWTIKTSIKKI